MLDTALTYCVGALPPEGKPDRFQTAQDCDIPKSERWVHAGALFFDEALKQWRYLDCDFHQGVTEGPWWWEEGTCKSVGIRFQAFPYRMSVGVLRSMIGQEFSKTKLRKFEQPESEGCDCGLTCGELLALAASVAPSVAKTVRAVDLQMIGQTVGLIDL